MKMLWSTCLLLALLSPVAPLKCKTCFSCGEKCRDEDTRTVECAPDQDACLVISVNYTYSEFPIAFTYKGCSRSQECEAIYDQSSTTVNNKYAQLKSRCCQTDECNAYNLHLPDHNSLPPNGLQCPGSLSASPDCCYGQETVHCRGNEDQCINSNFDFGPLGSPMKRVLYQGCVNKELCYFPLGYTEAANGMLKYQVYEVYCQPAQRWQPAKGSCKHPHQTKW